MLAHLFDRFDIVTKFMLPSMGDLKFSKLNFDHTCTYMNKEYAPNMDSRKYITELKTYCNKIKPFVSHYNNLIRSYNITVYNITQGIPGGSKIERGKTNSSQGTNSAHDRAINNGKPFLPDVPLHPDPLHKPSLLQQNTTKYKINQNPNINLDFEEN